MKIYVEFLEYRRCMLVNLFLFSPVVSGKCAEKIQVISEAVNDDNGMLIFTQVDTLHKTICVMLISRKGSHRLLWFEFSFSHIKKIWVRESHWIEKDCSLLCRRNMLLYLWIKACSVSFYYFLINPKNFNDWEWWV